MGSDDAPAPHVKENTPTSGLRDTAVTFASRIASMLLGLVWAFALAGLLGPDRRGSYAVCMQYAGLLTVIFMLGADVGSLYFVASRKMSPSEGAMALLVCSLAGSVVAIGVGYFLMQTGWEYFRKANPTSFYLALASIPIGFYSGALVYFLTALREFVWFGIFAVGQVLLSILLLLVYVWVLGLGVNGAMLVLITVNGCTLAAVWSMLRRKHNLRWMWPTGRGLRQVMGFGVRYYFGKVGNIVNFQLGTLLLAFSAATTEAEIGFFAFGLTLVEGVLFLPDTLTIVLSPRVFVDPKGRVELVTQCNRIVTVLCGAALVVGALLAPPFFALFVPEYLPAVVLVWILVPGVWSRSASKLFVPYLQSQNRVGIASVAVVAGGVVNLTVLLILLPVIGLPAAALGVVGNHVVVTAVLAAAFHRCSGQGVWASWRPRRSDWGLLWGALASLRSRAAAEGPAKI